jgi:hypothetical protein
MVLVQGNKPRSVDLRLASYYTKRRGVFVDTDALKNIIDMLLLKSSLGQGNNRLPTQCPVDSVADIRKIMLWWCWPRRVCCFTVRALFSFPILPSHPP